MARIDLAPAAPVADHASAVVRLQGVAKTYRSGAVDVAALRGISLDIPYHRFSVVIGASGSGKTTLLNLIGGIDSPTGGAVEGVSQAVAYGPFGKWQALSPADGFAGRPAVLQTPTGIIAIYARTSAGTLLGTSQHVVGGAFGSWGQLGTATNLNSEPAALITTANVIAIYATDTAGAVTGISQSVAYGPFGTWTEI